jgi:uncharacterized damage-inducible protein DinB
MDELKDLYRHNAWANDKVFDVALACEPPLLEGVAETLQHLARVEHAYLAMMEQRQPEDREQFLTHDVPWLREHLQQLGRGYLHLLETVTGEALQRDLQIPWFDFPVSVRDGLLQVLTHSAQHRSQVLSWLSDRAVQTPDLDYVLMLREAR